jgi:hypothetical protein
LILREFGLVCAPSKLLAEHFMMKHSNDNANWPGMPDGDCSKEVTTLYSMEGVLILRDFGLVCAPQSS